MGKGYVTKNDFDLLANKEGIIRIAGLFQSLGYVAYLPK